MQSDLKLNELSPSSAGTSSSIHFINLDFKIERYAAEAQVFFVEINDGILRADYSRYDALVAEANNVIRMSYRFLAARYKTIYLVVPSAN